MQQILRLSTLIALSASSILVLSLSGCGESKYTSGSSTTPPPIAQKTEATLKKTVDDYMASPSATGIPGAIVAIQMNGYQPWSYATGSASVPKTTMKTAMKVDLKSDMQFRIASITKMFIAQTVIELAKQGKIDLTKSVADYLPGALTVPYYDGTKITINQLLNHTSGIYSYVSTDGGLVNGAAPNMTLPMNQFVKERGQSAWPHDYNNLATNKVLSFVNTFLPPANIKVPVFNNVSTYASNPYGTNPYFAPGASGSWHYSNTNYYLLGLIIEKVCSPEKIEAVIDRLLAKPIGLTDTYLPSGKTFNSTNHVHGYTDYYNKTTYMTTWDDALLKFKNPSGAGWINGDDNLEEDFTEMDPSFAWTSGAMISSSKDLIKFLQYVMQTRIQSGEKPVWIPGSALPGTETFKYERGLVRITLPDGGGTAFGHGGQFAGYNVAAFWYADLDIYMVVMTNKYTYLEDQPNELVGQIASGASTLYKDTAKALGSKVDPNTEIINGILGVLAQEPNAAKTLKKAGIVSPRFPDVSSYMK